jgi:SulP family sulfate permease
VSERAGSTRTTTSVLAGLVVGAVEVVVAIALASLVFGGLLAGHLADGIGLYLVAGALSLAILAWTGGLRGVVGSLQDAPAAGLAVVATYVALGTFGGPDRAFLTAVAATLVVTVLCGVVFLVLGTLRAGNLLRFIPVPVVGGFLAGTGWLLLKGAIAVSSGVEFHIDTFGSLGSLETAKLWVPAVAFGLVLLLAVRFVKHPLVLPIALVAGLVAFAIGVLVTGSSLDAVREGGWLLGSFDSSRLWEPWTFRALQHADWMAVLGQGAGIAATVLVASVAVLFNLAGTEVLLDRDLDTNRELRDAGALNAISGAAGGIPAFHALGLTSLTGRMRANARTAGLVGALVPLAVAFAGGRLVELVPRMLVGGVLAFLGLSFLVEWVWDKRRVLPRVEYAIVLVILAGIVVRGFLPGVIIGLVMAVVLFAVSYGRIELVREVAFGETYRSNVDRPPSERAALRSMADRVQILRLHGFVFFGSANGLLEKVRRRTEQGGVRFLVLDLQRVSGVDASAVVSFAKVMHLGEASGFELVLAGATDAVRAQLERGGVRETPNLVGFEPDLDRGLQRCEEGLLEEAGAAVAAGDGSAGLPQGLSSYLERMELETGTTLIRQNDPAEDVFVLESGRLSVEMVTVEGTRMRVSTIRPGVVVGEVAHYAGVPRTADVIADSPSVVLRLSDASMERLETQDPELAAALHRWLATTLAERLSETTRAFDELLD